MDPVLITAVCAVVVSVISTGLAAWTAFVQRRHMRLSVRPIVAVPVADFEGRIGVFLQNTGLGPMMVKTLRVIADDGSFADDVITHMPELPEGVLWSNYHDSVDGMSLQNGTRVELLLLEGNPTNENFRRSRDNVRCALSTLLVRIEYQDLYSTDMEPYERSLSWFGRHRQESS
jgi:hypothetical protein